MRYNRLHKDNNFLTPTNYTEQLSDYTVNLKYEDIPAEVVERAKMIMLQTIGAALAAKGTPLAEKAYKMALEANGGEGGGTTVWGKGTKMAAVNAALALGTAADALDWEDCSWTGHPSAGVIPCAWLAAEERHKSGKDLITAIVAGYEVYHRIATAVQPSDERWKTKGWGLTSWQIFACIIPVAKLYGLDSRKINQAIGMGCESSTLPVAYHATTMSDFYHYEHGYRARDGFMIAKAAEKGVHNNRDALDEGRCYTAVICGDAAKNGSASVNVVDGASEADLTWLTKELGERYYIMDTLLKHWPANMWVQTPVELVSDMAKKHGFGPDDIEEMIIDPPIRARMWAPDEGFTSVTHAQFSAPYVIATMLYNPTPGAYWYTPEMMKDPKIIALAKKVKAGPSPEDSPMTGFKQFRTGSYPMKTITVKLKDGREFVGSMDCHPGHPANMMDREEFVSRFRIQASPVLQGEALEKAIDILCNIENVEDIASLTDLLK